MATSTAESLLWCNQCNAKILISSEPRPISKWSITHIGTAACSCSTHVIICGILIYHPGVSNQYVRSLYASKQFAKLVFMLCNEDIITRVLLYFLFIFRLTIHSVEHNRPGTGMRIVSTILFFLTGNKTWKYIANRTHLPSFYISLLSNQFLSRSRSCLDIGCGDARLLSFLARYSNGRFIGVDSSFLLLFLARLFHAESNVLLIHSTAEHVPIRQHTADTIMLNDSWQYVPKSKRFSETLKGVASSRATLLAFHIYNPDKTNRTHHIMSPTAPNDVIVFLRQAGFSYFSVLSNKKILSDLKAGRDIQLINLPPRLMNNAISYTLIASKIRILKGVHQQKNIQQLIKKFGVNYYQDNEMCSKISLEDIMSFDSFFFVSPHLDDAILSAGALIQLLRSFHKKITIISVFTLADDSPFSIVASDFMSKSGFSNAHTFFAERKKEDRVVCKSIGCIVKHLDLIDAAWRTDNTNELIYKSSKKQFGAKIAAADIRLVTVLKEKLTQIYYTQAEKKTLFLAPLGIGGHVDHTIVRTSIESTEFPVLYWEDFPYILDDNNKERFDLSTYSLSFTIHAGISQKGKLIRGYASQMPVLFPKQIIPIVPERYYERNLKTNDFFNFFQKG